MVGFLSQLADGLVAQLVPHTKAAAATRYWRFCYCKYGVAYRGLVEYKNGVWWFHGCEPAGTC